MYGLLIEKSPNWFIGLLNFLVFSHEKKALQAGSAIMCEVRRINQIADSKVDTNTCRLRHLATCRFD